MGRRTRGERREGIWGNGEKNERGEEGKGYGGMGRRTRGEREEGRGRMGGKNERREGRGGDGGGGENKRRGEEEGKGWGEEQEERGKREGKGWGEERKERGERREENERREGMGREREERGGEREKNERREGRGSGGMGRGEGGKGVGEWKREGRTRQGRVFLFFIPDTSSIFADSATSFLEHRLYTRLLNKLRVKGMNAVFCLQVQCTVGDTMIMGVAVSGQHVVWFDS